MKWWRKMPVGRQERDKRTHKQGHRQGANVLLTTFELGHVFLVTFDPQVVMIISWLPGHAASAGWVVGCTIATGMLGADGRGHRAIVGTTIGCAIPVAVLILVSCRWIVTFFTWMLLLLCLRCWRWTWISFNHRLTSVDFDSLSVSLRVCLFDWYFSFLKDF